MPDHRPDGAADDRSNGATGAHSRPARGDEQGLADAEQTLAEGDQTLADADQTSADSDQTGADSDQASADCDQLAADYDQAASDHDLAAGVDPEAHELSRGIRERTTHQREVTAGARLTEADNRDEAAAARDLAAAARDRAADARDIAITRLEEARDREPHPRGSVDVLLRAAQQRKRAAAQRADAAKHRAQAAEDRVAAAADRSQAAAERERSRADRHALAHELALAAIDPVTGARMRAAGLTELEHEVDRCRRSESALVVVFADAVGLKRRNDVHGHVAGDELLKDIVSTIKQHVRTYDLVIRIGGDEFVCAMSNISRAEVQARFRQIATALESRDDDAAITIGYGELGTDDTAADLMERADEDRRKGGDADARPTVGGA